MKADHDNIDEGLLKPTLLIFELHNILVVGQIIWSGNSTYRVKVAVRIRYSVLTVLESY